MAAIRRTQRQGTGRRAFPAVKCCAEGLEPQGAETITRQRAQRGSAGWTGLPWSRRAGDTNATPAQEPKTRIRLQATTANRPKPTASSSPDSRLAARAKDHQGDFGQGPNCEAETDASILLKSGSLRPACSGVFRRAFRSEMVLLPFPDGATVRTDAHATSAAFHPTGRWCAG